MATDIRDKLVNQGKDILLAANPPAKGDFLPQIPNALVDTELPIEVLNSMQQIETQSVTTINNERRRLDASAEALKEANVEIDSATRNIQAADGNLLLDFIGMFDSEYNRKFQHGRITNAKQKLQVKSQEIDLQRQRDQLDLKESSLPLDAYKQQVEFLSKQASLSTVQANAIIQSNSARLQMRKMLQVRYTDEELTQMQRTNTYDNVWSAQEVKKYFDDKKIFALDMEAKQLANASNRTDLAVKLEDRALSQIPLSWGNNLLAQAEKDKVSLIKIPGTTTTVPSSKLKTVLAERQKNEQKAFALTAESQLKLVKNDAEMSQMLSNVSNISSIFSGNGGELSNLPRLNMLNITDATMQDFPIDSIHPSLRADFQTVLGAAAILNEKSKPTMAADGTQIAPPAGVTTQDIFTFKQTVLDLNKKSEDIQKEIIDTAPDKGSKAAFKEWFANGSMQSQDNSAAMLVANSISLPNLGNDQALQASYQVLLENISQDILAGEVDLTDLEPEERTRVIFESLLKSDFKGKVASRDKILKALHTENAAGQTPISAYSSNRVLEITINGMAKLGEIFPEYQNYFAALKRDTGFSNPAELASNLAELSFRLQQQNPALPDLSLNNEFLDIVNGLVHAQKPQWDSQLNPVRGSLMNLMFNVNPSTQIDNSINVLFGSPSRNAWTKIQEETSKPGFGRRTPGLTFSTGEPKTQIFGNIPLPIPFQ